MWRFCAISVAAAAVCPPVPAEMQLLQTNFQLADARPAILKRIVFTRHGESTWLVAKRNGQISNNVFDNRRKLEEVATHHKLKTSERSRVSADKRQKLTGEVKKFRVN